MWKSQVNINLNSPNLSLEKDGLVKLINQSLEVKKCMGRAEFIFSFAWQPDVQSSIYNSVDWLLLSNHYVQVIVGQCSRYEDGENKSSSYTQEAYNPIEKIKETYCAWKYS